MDMFNTFLKKVTVSIRKLHRLLIDQMNIH